MDATERNPWYLVGRAVPLVEILKELTTNGTLRAECVVWLAQVNKASEEEPGIIPAKGGA